VVFGLTGATPAEGARAASAPVRSASEIDYPPYCTVTEDGRAAGFSVDLLRATLAAMGRDVVFRTGVWSTIRRDLEMGRIAVLPLVGRTPEREALYDFTVPYLTMHGAIVVRDDQRGIHAPADLAGRRVAVLEGDNAEEYLRRVDLGADIILLPSFQTALEGLSQGRYDAVVIQKLVALQIMKQAGIENLRIVGAPIEDFKQNFCFAVRKGDHALLAKLNEGLAIVHADGTFRRLYAEWFAPIESLGRRKSRVVIGGDRDYPPYEYLDSNGQPAGFNVELTRAAARQVNLEIEIRLGPWHEIRRGLAEGEIDAVLGMYYSPERNRSFAFSTPHSRVQHVIVTRRGAPPAPDMASLAGRSILVMTGDLMDDLAVEYGYETHLVRVGAQQEALRLLAAGRHDAALVARIPALYWIKQHGWSNLALSEAPVLAAEYCYAVPRGREELLDQLNEAVVALRTTGEDRRIRARWLDPYEAELTSARRIASYALMATVPLLLLLVASVLWSRTLRRQVAARTREIFYKTALLEAQSRATIDGIFILDRDDRLLFHNERFIAVWSVSPPAVRSRDGGRIWAEIFASLIDPTSLRNAVETREERPHGESTRCDGRIVEWHSAPLALADGEAAGRAWYFRDVTEHRRLDEQILHSRKMESIGMLAGGIAHDFNNLLTVISGALEDLRRSAGDEATRAGVAEIASATQRAADLTRHLLALGRRQVLRPRIIDLNAAIGHLERILRRAIREDIELTVDLAPDLLRVKADPGQVQQILMNLAVNAREAMPRGGRLSIQTMNLRWDCPTESGGVMIPAGDHVLLKVADDGVGMTPEVRAKAFDPFFTTRGAEGGTGLGLATVHGIVTQSGGWIRVESALGRGTAFHIILPGLAAEPESPPDVTGAAPVAANGEQLLVVDDEQGVRRVLQRALERHGFRVQAAANGEEALALAATMERIDLLVTDVVMPKMGGLELADRLTAARPRLPILYVSGHINEMEKTAGRFDETNFLAKPFSIAELLARVASLLKAPKEDGA
jgi:two-component system sensor histidine kinase EvgS